MGIKIDEQTQIIYKNYVVDAKALAEDHAQYEGKFARKVKWVAQSSNAPEDSLIFRDIFASPLEIVRVPEYGNLVLQASIVRREEVKGKSERPYTSIALTPTKGKVASVRYLSQNLAKAINFRLKEATPTHIAFDSIRNLDLEMRVDYQSR